MFVKLVSNGKFVESYFCKGFVNVCGKLLSFSKFF